MRHRWLWGALLLTATLLELRANEDAAMRSLAEGVQLFGRGEPSRAIPYIQRAIALEPQSWPVAYFNLGMAHLELKQHGPAWAAFSAAYRVNPSDPEPQALLKQAALAHCETETAEATLAAAQGAVQQAERQLERLLQQMPRCGRALETLGPLQLMSGRARRALGVPLSSVQGATY